MEDRAHHRFHGDVAAGFDDETDYRLQEGLIEEGCGGNLAVGDKDERLRRSADLRIHLIAQDANNGERLHHSGVDAAEADLLSERILSGKVLSGEGLIDDGDRGAPAASSS